MSKTGFDPDVAAALAAESDPTGVNPEIGRYLGNTHEPQRIALAEVRLYHRNPRKGNVDALKSSLMVNGQYKPVVINAGTHTGRSNEILAGNHTVLAMRDLALKYPADTRWHGVLVHVVDVDEDQAARIVAADNKVSDLGTYDSELLADLLSSLPDLTGTGYTNDDLAKLLTESNVTEGDAETNDVPHAYGVVIECESETQQIDLLDRLEAEGLNCRALM